MGFEKFAVILILLTAFKLVSLKAECFGNQEKPSSSASSLNLGSNEPEVLQDFQQVLYDRQLEFSLNLFHKLYNKDEKTNLFFSPHSIHKALMLAFFGSSGETEAQLRKALELKPDTSKCELIQQYKMESYFMETRAANRTQYDLKIANKMFFSDEEPVRDCVTEILDTEIERLNFVNETEASREKINSWVSTNTNGKIKNIIPSGYISSQTRLAIANSAYFKGNWEQRFKKINTKISLFYISTKEVTQTYMMYQKGAFRHGASEALKSYIIELPYEGEALSMYILLPPFTPNAIEETISRLNASSLREAIDQNQLYHEKIEVSLPRFKIEQTFELNKALEAIGIVDLFDTKKANLSDFSKKPELAIGTARHKSFVEVNEEGSEAAASTVLIDTRSGRPLDQTRFICNHPFIFFIHDNAANTILFMGAFRNPKMTDKN